MSTESKSCTVALHRACNHATFTQNDATEYATKIQPTNLKALAIAVLQRNLICNQDATVAKITSNFFPEKSTQKLHRNCAVEISPQKEKSLACYCCKGSDFWLSIHGK